MFLYFTKRSIHGQKWSLKIFILFVVNKSLLAITLATKSIFSKKMLCCCGRSTLQQIPVWMSRVWRVHCHLQRMWRDPSVCRWEWRSPRTRLSRSGSVLLHWSFSMGFIKIMIQELSLFIQHCGCFIFDNNKIIDSYKEALLIYCSILTKILFVGSSLNSSACLEVEPQLEHSTAETARQSSKLPSTLNIWWNCWHACPLQAVQDQPLDTTDVWWGYNTVYL